MEPRPVLRAIVPVFAVTFSMLALACTSAPAAVPIQATPAEISALAGHWEGEYSSKATGRLGSIVLDLIAGEDHAHGDVLMIPRGSNDPYRPARRPGGQGPGPAEATQLLKIRFIRAEGAGLSGTLEPYWDPDCNCARRPVPQDRRRSAGSASTAARESAHHREARRPPPRAARCTCSGRPARVRRRWAGRIGHPSVRAEGRNWGASTPAV